MMGSQLMRFGLLGTPGSCVGQTCHCTSLLGSVHSLVCALRNAEARQSPDMARSCCALGSAQRRTKHRTGRRSFG